MIEIADVFRRFAADYLAAHGASLLPSHHRAIEEHPGLPHRRPRRPGLALRGMWRRDVLLPFLR